MVQVEENGVLTDSQRLFSELADEWFEQYKNTVRESTYVAQKLAYKNISYFFLIFQLDWIDIIRFQGCFKFTAYSK